MSETEPELGLGTVARADGRYVDIDFTTRETSRRYSIAGAPLRRMVFTPGDAIQDKNGSPHTVMSVLEDAVTGLVTYGCGGKTIREDAISDTANTASPIHRLLSCMIARAEDFDLRYDALTFKAEILSSPVHGFVGGRVDLLPYQLTIAEKVSSRKITRALLADETGLGKTIEACLILNRLMVSGRVCRCLIVAPEHLVHQWFVELLRRFNCAFAIFSEDKCVPDGAASNPFLSEMTGICSIDLLTKNPGLGAQAAEASWDLVIVDEAHHLQQDGPAFEIVKRLSQRSSGLLLLTATPEQLGRKGHFARLQLLDPHRYANFDVYVKESEAFQRIGLLVEKALHDKNLGKRPIALDSCEIDMPHDLSDSAQEKKSGAPNDVRPPDRITLGQIIDLYGTGRIMFRNTRQVIAGFPERSVHIVPLPGSEEIRQRIRNEAAGDIMREGAPHGVLILPDDPRVMWLVQLLKKNAHKKVLVICTSKAKAEGIAEACSRLCTIKTALFHEDMTIIQRDRNAAWFSEENGARMLVCSEIGSEGRNFQFCQCLALFDLPLHPELLEQRIGRLDRIGQRPVIDLYVPFVQNTFHEALMRWYHEGLDVFNRNVPAAGLVFEALHDRLLKAFDGPSGELDRLVDDARHLRDTFMEQQYKARDSMLFLSLFQPHESRQLIDRIRSMDLCGKTISMMDRLFKHYGIVIEEAGKGMFALVTDYLTDSGFPLPRGERPIITYDRSTALAREDVEFLTIDHPMVMGGLDLFLSSGQGTASFIVWDDPGVKDVLLETMYIVECIAPAHLNSDRFLPPVPIRLVINQKGEDVTKTCSTVQLRLQCKNGPMTLFRDLCKTKNSVLTSMVETSKTSAHELSLPIINNAIQAMRTMLDREIGRMVFLQERNQTADRAETECLVKEKTELEKYLAASTVRLDSVRLIFRGPLEKGEV